MLLVAGVLLGLVMPLAVVARNDGVSTLAFVFWSALLSGLALAVASGGAFTRGMDLARLRYALIAGLLSTALPNILTVLVVPRLGAGLTGVVFIFPPLFTLVLAVAVRLEGLSRRRLVGLGLGFLGALGILLPEITGPTGGQASWLLLAFAIPAIIAVGNIFRTVAWPEGATPRVLAPGMLLAAAAWAGLAMFLMGDLWWPSLDQTAGSTAVLGQAVAMTLAFAVYFELQLAAGPVYLSQLGYVVTATGLLSGVVLFGERPPVLAWLALGLVAAGVAVVNQAPAGEPAKTG